MMIEAMAQTAGVIGIKSIEGTEKPRAVYFLTIDKCKFRKPVMPGDTIEYHMRTIGRRKAMWWFHGDAKVTGRPSPKPTSARCSPIEDRSAIGCARLEAGFRGALTRPVLR